MRHPDMGKVTVTQVLLSIVGALAPVLIVVVLITGHMLNIFATFGKPDAAGSDAATLARIKPVGEYAVVSAAAAPAEAAAIDGKKVYSYMPRQNQYRAACASPATTAVPPGPPSWGTRVPGVPASARARTPCISTPSAASRAKPG